MEKWENHLKEKNCISRTVMNVDEGRRSNGARLR